MLSKKEMKEIDRRLFEGIKNHDQTPLTAKEEEKLKILLTEVEYRANHPSIAERLKWWFKRNKEIILFLALGVIAAVISLIFAHLPR